MQIVNGSEFCYAVFIILFSILLHTDKWFRPRWDPFSYNHNGSERTRE